MFDQLFTDGVMFWLSMLTALCVAVLLALFLRAHGSHSIWWMFCAAYLVPHILLTLGYYFLWASPDTPTLQFPLVAVLTRPGIAGIYFFIVVLFAILYKVTTAWLRQ